ncbi:hypothetical protein CK203_094031 [Vitis vinifera]|uniref:Uncharacterized protein n=1 Tax=Vitis vinifera TaxID=29760 RepID=A0A438BRS9_VITVI|nr:hypothetical protein CK203_094031 [Vitis vinifera]
MASPSDPYITTGTSRTCPTRPSNSMAVVWPLLSSSSPFSSSSLSCSSTSSTCAPTAGTQPRSGPRPTRLHPMWSSLDSTQ